VKKILISGWATGNGIWSEVSRELRDTETVSWNTVLTGDFSITEPCIVVGWSLGGQMAMDLSMGEEVMGLVLVSSMTSLNDRGVKPGLEPEMCSMISKMLHRSRRAYLTSFFKECGASPEMVPELLDNSDRFAMEELIAGLSVMFNHMAVPRDGVPAVLIHGTDDRIVPWETAVELSDSILTNSRLITVENGQHILPVTHGDLIAKAVMDLEGSLNL